MIVTDTIQDRVEDFFEDKGCCVEAWDTDKEGNTLAIVDLCPCEDEHSTDSTPPVWVYFSPYIKIMCLHKSCEESLWGLSKELWAYLDKPEANGSYTPSRRELSPEQKQRQQQRMLLNEQKDAVVKFRESGLIESTYCGFRLDTNYKQLKNPYADFITTLYKPSDLLWCGEHDGSGEHAIKNGKCTFATARELVEHGKPQHPFIGNSVYKNNSTNRKASNVLQQKYIVLEWDGLTPALPHDKQSIDLNLKRSWMLFYYVSDMLNLNHVATIYSGNKSYHYWCERPSEDKITWLRHCANDLRFPDSISGLDTACLGASQPCRTPSYFRQDKDREQKLLYLNA